MIASPGFCFIPVNITLPATNGAILEAFVSAPQNLDLKIVGVNCVCTGNWSMLWGNNTSNFSIGSNNNVAGFIGYQNFASIGVLAKRFRELDFNGNVVWDYCPLIPKNGILNLQFRNDAASVNSIELGIEGEYGNFIS